MILLNEKEYAEKCLREKVVIGKPFFTLGILAKYYYSEGYRKKKIVELLTDFIDKSYYGYSTDKSEWDKTIEKIAKSAGKYPLHEIEGVWITQSEIDRVKSLNNQSLEQVLFTILCIAKLNHIKNPNNTGWVNVGVKEIFEIARVSCSALKRNEVIGALYDLKLLELPKDNSKVSMRITFLDDVGDKVIFISDFRELGYEWLNYCGGKFIRCQECGILTRYTRNRRYCKNCSSQEPQETRSVICVDCGKRFTVGLFNSQSCRCHECYDIYRKKYKAQKELERRERVKAAKSVDKPYEE